MKKIILFNHKGGVSKTTTTFNLGWKVAEKNHRVLLVDADPQCNLTALFLGKKFDEYYINEETKKYNIKDGVKMAFDGQPTAIEAVKCATMQRNSNLFLLPGHMNLSEYDAQLNFAQNASAALSSLKSLPGAFNDLITKTASSYDLDYVFIDLNPGLSSINQNLFLISDAFIIPTNPDIFSLMALKSLSMILPRWVLWKSQNIGNFADSAYPLPDSTPMFLGEIAQRFNIRNGEATTPYKFKIQQLIDVTKNILIPSFCKSNMLFSQEKYQSVGLIDNYNLAEIKDFQGLAPKSQAANVPVFALTDEELNATGAALKGMKRNRDGFGEIYDSVADQIIQLLSD